MKDFRPNVDLLPWLFLAAVWTMSFVYTATPLNDEVLCIWRNLFDLSCPGCGLTRSFVALSAGSFVLAAQYHLAGPSLYIAMVWCVLVWALRWWRGRVDWLVPPKKLLFVFWVTTAFLFLVQTARVVLSWGEM